MRLILLVVLIAAVAGLVLAGFGSFGDDTAPVPPVIRLETTVTTAGPESDLARRIEGKGTDEVAELGLTFNHMLDRLEGVFTTQQSFFDDAGHELRTLITILRGHLAAHGGAVELADRPGGGSMFTIVIPVRPTSA